jgi:hypothetical protein
MALTVSSGTENVTTGRTRVSISHNTTVGPLWSSLVDDPTGTPVTISPIASVDSGDNQGGFWWIEGRDRDGNVYRLTPDDSQFYEMYAPDTQGSDTAVLLEWRGITTPGIDSTLWVRIAVIDASGADGVRLAGWCGREMGDDFEILFFEYPQVYMEQYAGGTGTQREQAMAQRILAPNNINLLTPEKAQNYTLGVAAKAGASTLTESLSPNPDFGIADNKATSDTKYHPMPFWPIGFVATCALNPATASYRTWSMVRFTEYGEPWAKKITCGVPRGQGEDDSQYMQWRFAHLPRLANDWANPGSDGLRPDTPYRNTCGPQWTPEVITGRSTSHAWWWDIASNYRTYYESVRSPSRVSANANIRDYRKGPSFTAVTQYSLKDDGNVPRTNTNFPEWQDGLDWYRDVLQPYLQGVSTFGPATKNTIFHHQVWQWYFNDDVNMPQADLSDVPEWLSAKNESLGVSGWMLSSYYRFALWYYQMGWVGEALTDQTSHIIQSIEDGQTIDKQFFTEVFNNVLQETLRFHKVELSLDTTDMAAFAIKVIRRYKDAMNLDSTYADTFGGAWRPDAVRSTKTGEGWGTNKHVSVRRQIGNLIRDGFGSDHTLTTEAVTEWMEDFDLVLGGTNYYFRHQTNGWEVLQYDTGVVGTVVGLTAGEETRITAPQLEDRDPNPPLWQAIHNRWNPQAQFTCEPVTVQRTGSPFVTSGGLSETEWLLLNCYAVSTAWIVGSHNTLWIHNINRGPDYMPITTSGGAGASLVPTAGPQYMSFLRELASNVTSAYAGQFLIDGNMERPLEVDYSANNTMITAPTSGIHDIVWNRSAGDQFGLQDAADADGAVTYFTYPTATVASLDAVNNASLTVPAVLCTMWRNPDTNTLGACLVNWSNADADFRFTFNRADYGFSTTVTVNELDTAGTPSALGTSTAASFTIGNSGATINTGAFGARSFKVLTFTGS